MNNNDRRLIALMPSVRADLDQASLAVPDVPAERVRRFLAAKMTELAGNQEPFGRPSDHPALSGVGEVFIQLPQGPPVAVLHAIHPADGNAAANAVEGPPRPPVLNFIAAAAVANQDELNTLHETAAQRIHPPGHERIRTFSAGVFRDLSDLADAQSVTWAAINSLTRDGASPPELSELLAAINPPAPDGAPQPGTEGEQLDAPLVPKSVPTAALELSVVHSTVDLRGTRFLPFDEPKHLAAGHTERYGLVFRILPRPPQADFDTIQIVSAGTRQNAEAFFRETANRITLQAGPEQTAQTQQTNSRAQAARARSTNGTAPQVPTSRHQAAREPNRQDQQPSRSPVQRGR